MLRAYAVYDRKSLVYAPPFYSQTDGSAIRALTDAVADTKSAIGAHPNDYVLFFVGTYDDQKGQLTGVQPLGHVIDCAALVNHQAEMFGRQVPLDLVKPLRTEPNGSDDHMIKEA